MIDLFLSSLTQSIHTKRHKKSILEFVEVFFTKIHPVNGDFFSLTPNDFLEYFKFIDQRDIITAHKRKYRSALFNYSDWLVKPLYCEGKQSKWDYSYIFSNRFYDFKSIKRFPAEYSLPLKEIQHFIKYLRNKCPPKVYVGSLLLMTTGMRIGGLLRLTPNHINFDSRMIKTTEKTGETGYVLHLKLVEKVKEYCSFFGSDELLFPIEPQNFNSYLNGYDKRFSSRVLRNSYNEWLEGYGIEESIRDILQCRIPQSINAKHYLRKYNVWSKRIDKYDSIQIFQNISF